jgi:hypothetical protein
MYLVNFELLKSSKLTIEHFGSCKIKEFFKTWEQPNDATIYINYVLPQI